MTLVSTLIPGKFLRPGYEVRCCKCYFTANAGLTQQAACKHAMKLGFRQIPTSDRPNGKRGCWLCKNCYNKWDVHLTIQQFLRR